MYIIYNIMCLSIYCSIYLVMQREVNRLFTFLCIQRWKSKKPYALPWLLLQHNLSARFNVWGFGVRTVWRQEPPCYGLSETSLKTSSIPKHAVVLYHICFPLDSSTICWDVWIHWQTARHELMQRYAQQWIFDCIDEYWGRKMCKIVQRCPKDVVGPN